MRAVHWKELTGYDNHIFLNRRIKTRITSSTLKIVFPKLQHLKQRILILQAQYYKKLCNTEIFFNVLRCSTFLLLQVIHMMNPLTTPKMMGLHPTMKGRVRNANTLFAILTGSSFCKYWALFCKWREYISIELKCITTGAQPKKYVMIILSFTNQ